MPTATIIVLESFAAQCPNEEDKFEAKMKRTAVYRGVDTACAYLRTRGPPKPTGKGKILPRTGHEDPEGELR